MLLTVCATLSGASAVACSQLADFDLKQCTKDADCQKANVTDDAGVETTYTCDTKAHVCVAPDVPVDTTCMKDADCRNRGTGTESDICENNTCTNPECTGNASCVTKLGTNAAICQNNRCEDPVWGCLFDDAELPAAKAKFKFSALVIDLAGNPVAGAVAESCRPMPGMGCGTLTGGPVATDTEGKVGFDVTAGTRGFDGLFRVEADGLIPLEFHTLGVVREDLSITEAAPLVMVPTGTIHNFGLLGDKDIDESTSAIITMRFYDCMDRPAPGLFIDPLGSPNSFFFSSGESFTPKVDATGTSEEGIGGVVNLNPGLETLNITDVESQRVLYSFPIYVHANTTLLAYVHAKQR
jgi:hypothetical protein